MASRETFPTIPMAMAPNLTGRLKVASFLLNGVSTEDRSIQLEQEIERLSGVYRSLWSTPSDALEALKPARKLYHALGIDPSKTRPSSEALLRRILKAQPLFRVNAIVDAANVVSLTLLLPVGLYDAKTIIPPITLRFGAEGEEYAGIRKDTVHLFGRPTLVDTLGPFGNPTSDSMRTCVTEMTTEVWFVLFAPEDYPNKSLHDDLHRARAILTTHAKV